jgi:hypothetical protein
MAEGDDLQLARTAILSSLAVINSQLTTLHSDLKEMKTLLKGDGPNPGLQMRVDRLEQVAQRNGALHLIWAGSTISAIVAWFISKLN